MNKVRLKTCKACGSKFEPTRQMQVACGWQCAIEHSRKLKEARDRKEHRAAKERLKTRRDWMREAQSAFNRYIRLRDTGQPCISCGRHHHGQYHAGHYLSVGARPELRFDERNAHLQCQPCNTHLSGNIVRYRQGLIQKLGLAAVEWLEGPHGPKQYSIEELKAIKADYTWRAREIEKRLDTSKGMD